ncbi:MAG TPA: Do family serine endopeptidase [Opitutaceae bacterium]|nr:Do family serine endopeptidase [Opitutaceae bacterium]
MNSTVSPLRRRLAIAAGGLCALGLVAGTVLRAEQGHDAPKVAVQSDSKPVDRSAMIPASFANIAKRVSPCVVKVTVQITNPNGGFDSHGFDNLPDPFRQFFNQIPQHPQRESGIGSGVIISPDGYIVTNNHVVDHATEVHVSFSDGRDMSAKVVGRDPETDVAVIKVNAHGLPAITFADSSKVEVGDRVLAIGNPFGFGESVTSGIVSATGRQMGILDDQPNHGLEDFIQTDAAINPGNSGGALVDIEGRLIGIPSAIYSHTGGFQGAGFAVPSDLVKHELNSLVTTGHVSHGRIGVTVQNLNPALADSFGVKNGTNGALVTDVSPGSPASRAGLQSGDVITGLNGEPVKDSEALHLAIGEMSAGTHLKLQVLREGKTKDFALTTTGENGMREGAQGQSGIASNDDKGVLNGVYVGDLDDQARQQYNIPERVRGAVITEVSQDSASAEAGLEPGDVILEINHHRVTDADQAVKLSEDATSKKTLLKLWSHGGTIYTLVDESGTPAS